MKKLRVFILVLLFLIAPSEKLFAQDLNELFVKDRILELPDSYKETSLSFYPNQLDDLTKPVKYRVPILMYHYIGSRDIPNDATRSALSTWPHVLEEQIKTLKKAGYTFITNSELSVILDFKITLPEKPIVLTFDDSYKDFYTNAYPILKRYNAKATIYVITGFLNHPNHLSVDELKELSKDDSIEIAAHTIHHEWLKNQESDVDELEISQGKKNLEGLINKEVVSFAYPYGAFDEQTIEAVKSSGFKSAVSTLPGIEQSSMNRFVMYRLRPGERTGQLFLDWLSQDKFLAF